MRAVVIIPARYGSQRLPGKPLAMIQNKPMIQWVYERARSAPGIDHVVVATDDSRITQAVESFGGEAVMTSPQLESGTVRVAAAAQTIEGDIFINVQGDEPLLEGVNISKTVDLVANGQFDIGTLMTPLLNIEELENRNVVKVLVNAHKRALYFSRLPIPFGRQNPSQSKDLLSYRHLGIYSFTRKSLAAFAALPPHALEVAEGLEQLRAMAAGMSLGVELVQSISFGIDTEHDLNKVRQYVKG